jgi:hypothetical protein
MSSDPKLFTLTHPNDGRVYDAVVVHRADLDALPARSPSDVLPYGRRCGFCSSAEPAVWDYPAHAVELPTTVGFKAGALVAEQHWMWQGACGACVGCAELIEAGDWPALARRALRTAGADLHAAPPGTRARLLALSQSSHACFRQARMAAPRCPSPAREHPR